ncbi:MAG: hypothetical protein JKY02_02680 [Flavobacteriaceae bacterium]|nr:hypothetical protein [Flavobacteriaceae bacterium]
MTHQDFNHIYFKFTGNNKGIKPKDFIKTSGKELKEFVEFVLKTQTSKNLK